MQLLAQQILGGLAVGSGYALAGMGLSLIFYVRRIVQIAQGQVLMAGAYMGLLAAYWFSDSAISMLLLAGFGTALLGLLIDLGCLRPFQQRRDDIPAIVMTIALGILFAEAVRLVYNSGVPVQYRSGFPLGRVIGLGPVQTDGAGLIAFGLAVAVAVAVHVMLRRTRVGLGLQVMSGNPTTARLLGIPVNRLAAITVAVGSALAGVGGVLVGTRIGQVAPDIGDLLGLKAIAVALFAGLGNVVGALVCGLALGVAEALIQTYTNGSYQDAVAFGMIIVILLARPRGLFGVPREMAGEA